MAALTYYGFSLCIEYHVWLFKEQGPNLLKEYAKRTEGCFVKDVTDISESLKQAHDVRYENHLVEALEYSYLMANLSKTAS